MIKPVGCIVGLFVGFLLGLRVGLLVGIAVGCTIHYEVNCSHQTKRRNKYLNLLVIVMDYKLDFEWE